MLRKEQSCRYFIFERRKRTGRIDERSAVPEHNRRVPENFLLPFGTGTHVVLAPHGKRLLLLAEHPLAGAWRVNDNSVKERRKSFGKLLRGFVRNNRVPDAHPLHVLRKDPRPAFINLVGNKKSLPVHHTGKLR